MPRAWAAASSPDWTFDDCAVCGRRARNAKHHILVDLGDNGTMDTDGEQALPVGSECRKQVPAEYLS